MGQNKATWDKTCQVLYLYCWRYTYNEAVQCYVFIKMGLSLNIWHVFWKVLRTGSARGGGISMENTPAWAPRMSVCPSRE